MKLILASQSPRRAEILSYFSLPFEQIPSHIEERAPAEGEEEGQYAMDLALQKARSIAAEHPDRLVLGADTIVVSGKIVYGKPGDLQQAEEMLDKLSGKSHRVITGIALVQNERAIGKYATTHVTFHPTTPQQRKLYLQQIHPFDKAGSYAAQMAGGIIIEKIEGCFYNVMGLPIGALSELLQEFKIDLWNHLSPR